MLLVSLFPLLPVEENAYRCEPPAMEAKLSRHTINYREDYPYPGRISIFVVSDPRRYSQQMTPSVVKIASRLADKPTSQHQHEKCTEITVSRWLKLSRRELSEIKRKEGPGV
jgi:hypothetical protein